MEMSGVRAAWTGEAAIRAARAGADFILLPPDPEVACRRWCARWREGQLSEARLDESVLRILETKERLGLHKSRLVDPDQVGRSVGPPRGRAARACDRPRLDHAAAQSGRHPAAARRAAAPAAATW
jgi:beta-N-acetylhexosaminidase